MSFFKRSILLSAALLLFMTSSAFAVQNNNENVPTWLINELKNLRNQKITSATANGPGSYCDHPNTRRKHGQESWLSQVNNNNDQEISVAEGTNSINVWYNAIAFTCDALYTPSGDFENTNLKRTQVNVESSSASVVPQGVNLTTSGLGSNIKVNFNYNNAYFFKQRFVKSGLDSNNLPKKDPPHYTFTVAGLSSLPARDAPYTIRVKVRDYMVNEFPSQFLCVYNPTDTTTNNLNDSNNRCDRTTRTFDIKLKVNANWAGECSVTEINGTSPSSVSLTPGEGFNATFKVKNSGTKPWVLVNGENATSDERVILKATDDKWGRDSVTIEGPPEDFGGAAMAPGKDNTFTVGGFSVPSTEPSGEKTFSWDLRKLGTPSIPQLDNCGATFEVKANQPFLRVSGGDVRAGAWFSDGTGLQCGVNQNNATAAEIKTSGYWKSDFAASFQGISTSQYAVLAAGLIGSSGNNNFAGNNAYPRESRKDLTLANTGNDGESYGNLYGGSSAYCQDVSKIITDSDGVVPADLGASEISGTKVYYKDSDLTISSPVRYIGSYVDAGSIPNLVVIVRGNIYLESSVGQIDGTYIAIPDENGEGGIIDTCSDVGEAGEWPDPGGTLSTQVCDTQLIINGRLIARDVIWKRTNGTIGSPDTVLDSRCTVFEEGRYPLGDEAEAQRLLAARLEQCAAEFINMTPEVYFGSETTDSDSPSSVGNVPVSSIELPPIY